MTHARFDIFEYSADVVRPHGPIRRGSQVIEEAQPILVIPFAVALSHPLLREAAGPPALKVDVIGVVHISHPNVEGVLFS